MVRHIVLRKFLHVQRSDSQTIYGFQTPLKITYLFKSIDKTGKKNANSDNLKGISYCQWISKSVFNP